MGRAPCCEKVGLKKGSWTAEEDEKLLNYITAHGEGSWKSLPKNAGRYTNICRCWKFAWTYAGNIDLTDLSTIVYNVQQFSI